MNEIYVGQTGVQINFDLAYDISSYSAAVINVKLPSGATTTWTASVTSATEGTIYYTVASVSDLAYQGKYKLQPKVTMGDGSILYGKSVEMEVFSLYT